MRYIEEFTWDGVRNDVERVNSALANIIDNLNLDKKYTLFKARYQFGDEIIKKGSLYLPHKSDLIALQSSEFPNKTKEKLGYNLGSNPVSVILNNSAELFILLDRHTIPLYGLIPPGKIFSTTRVLTENSLPFVPAFIWNMTAGARSIFMLPRISDYVGHKRIMQEFNLDHAPPKSLLDHWSLFRSLMACSGINASWHTEILFFTKKWLENLNDEAWREFKLYLLQTAWDNTDFWRNQYVWDLVFCIVQQNKNLKPNPYIADTVKHLLEMGVGASPGFAPAIDNIAAPCELLEQIYTDVYRIKDYQPILMHPYVFSPDESRAVYYSLAYPTSTLEFSPKLFKASNKITDLREIAYIIKKYFSEIASNSLNLQGTPFYNLANFIKFDYFHTNVAKYNEIKDCSKIPDEDKFMQPLTKAAKSLSFPGNSPFVRGSIRIMAK